MTRTVVGMFHDMSEAQKVVQELLQQGVSKDDISVLARAEQGNAPDPAVPAAGLAGLSVVYVPDTGRVLVGGPIAKALAEAGAKGTLEDAFATVGIKAATVSAYHTSLQAGSVLVAVRASEERLAHLGGLMGRYRTIDVAPGAQHQGEIVLPIVEETLHVGKREVQRGGVRVFSHVTERPVEETVRLREEHVTVQRNPVDRALDPQDRTAFKEGTFEVRQRAEVAVVAKEARIVEEVVIGKQVNERTETIRDTVKRTEVQVEQLPTPPAPAARK